MKAGDKVIPAGFPKDSRPGTVLLVGSKKVAVSWTMGSGWNWVANHTENELEVVTA